MAQTGCLERRWISMADIGSCNGFDCLKNVCHQFAGRPVILQASTKYYAITKLHSP